MIVDANDLDIEILGKNKEIPMMTILWMNRDNQPGRAGADAFVLIRKHGS